MRNSDKNFFKCLDDNSEGLSLVDIRNLHHIDFNVGEVIFVDFADRESLEEGLIRISPEFQSDGRPSWEKARELIYGAATGDRITAEWVVENLDGEMILFELNLLPGHDSGNSLIRATFKNIMERKAMLELLSYYDERFHEIGRMQSHQVRNHVANLIGLLGLVDFENFDNPANRKLLSKIKVVSGNFDSVIHEITQLTNRVKSVSFGCRKNNNAFFCKPDADCRAEKSCFNFS